MCNVIPDGNVYNNYDSVFWVSYGRRSPNVSSYGSSSFDVLDSGEVMGGELAPESYGIFYFL